MPRRLDVRSNNWIMAWTASVTVHTSYSIYDTTQIFISYYFPSQLLFCFSKEQTALSLINMIFDFSKLDLLWNRIFDENE